MKNQKKNKKLKKKQIRNTRKKRGNNNHKQKGDNKMKNETITELVKYRDNLLCKTEEEVEEWYENEIKILDERWNKDVENGHHSPFGISFCDVSYDPCFDDKKHYQDNLNCVETNRSWFLSQVKVMDDILSLLDNKVNEDMN